MGELSEAIISIKPSYAEAILSGAKTVELRRRIPAIVEGTRLWIYATQPVGAIIGIATVDQIFRGEPDEMWVHFSERSGVERADYDAYFDGAQEAVGLVLVEVQRSEKHVEIEMLRTLRSGFHPPQVITWINEIESRNLRRMAEIE